MTIAPMKKIGKGFWQSGYGRGLNKAAAIYLIDGYCYARSKRNWEQDWNPLGGELAGFVRVNAHKNQNTGEYMFVQCHDHGDKHSPFQY